MLLAIDVGNTNTVFAIHDGEKFSAEWRCNTESVRTADQYFVWLRQLMEHAGLDAADIRDVVISNTAPATPFAWQIKRTHAAYGRWQSPRWKTRAFPGRRCLWAAVWPPSGRPRQRASPWRPSAAAWRRPAQWTWALRSAFLRFHHAAWCCIPV